MLYVASFRFAFHSQECNLICTFR